MNIDEIEIGSIWTDSWGVQTFDKNDNKIVGSLRKVVITNKTSNSIEYRDTKGYLSWVTLEEFIRLEKSINKVRFIKYLGV